MRTIFIAAILAVCGSQAKAAEGMPAYEFAASSTVIAAVNLSSTTFTLISRTPAQSVQDYRGISWYSTTVYNVNSSSAVYKWSPSATTIPSGDCDDGDAAPIGTGSQVSPWHVTEQFEASRMYLFGLSCGNNVATRIIAVFRGR